MALNGCLQIILIVAVAFLSLYFLQNMSGRSRLFGETLVRTNSQTEENFGGYEINPSKYDVPPNEALASKLNMPQNSGCQGPYDCDFTPPPAPTCNDNGEFPEAPTCPNKVVDQCGSYPEGQDLAQASCFPRSQLTPEELLPTEECNVWSKSNPYGSGSLADRNFLQAGWATGISTVGSTMRNANLQLRSEPPNPQVKVSPWLQTTINPDFGRKPLELGGCQ